MSKEMIYSLKQNNIICISRSQKISSFLAHLFKRKRPKSDLCFSRRVLNKTPESPAGSAGESKDLFALFGATVSGFLELSLCCRCPCPQETGIFTLLRFGILDTSADETVFQFLPFRL